MDPITNTSEGVILQDEEIGGPIGTMTVLNETTAYVTIFDDDFNNFVVPIDLSTLTIGSPLTDIGTGFIAELAFDSNGFMYVPDRDTANPGIHVFDTMTDEKVEGPIDTGLPPFAIAFTN